MPSDILKIWFKELRAGFVMRDYDGCRELLRIWCSSTMLISIHRQSFLAICNVLLRNLSVRLCHCCGELKQDPAVMAGPLITTLVDVIDFDYFFGHAFFDSSNSRFFFYLMKKDGICTLDG